ncbi:MAG: hypothetical protein Q8R13_01660 [bacterium]|nr:hypothetical protein [bacterium]
MTEELRRQIEQGLADWDKPDSPARFARGSRLAPLDPSLRSGPEKTASFPASPARKRFDAAMRKLDEEHRPYRELLEAADRPLTADDLNFRITI